MNLSNIEKQRDEAFLSLDREKIIAYYKTQGVTPSSDEVLWASAHKARLYLPCISPEGKEMSRKWLIDNSYTPVVPHAQQLMNAYNNSKSGE